MSKEGKAKADPRSIAAQLDALSQWKAQTSPQVTAQERYLEEVARQNEEQTLAQQRAGIAQNMRAQGTGGSGSELAMNLAAQSQQGQNRMMQDLGTNAQAVQRSQNALQNYGGLATDIRTQSFGEAARRGHATDSVNEYNKGVRVNFHRDKKNLEVSERDKGVERSGLVLGARVGNIKDETERAGGIYGNEAQGAGLRIGTNVQGLGITTQPRKDVAGNELIERAKKEVQKVPFDPLNPWSW